MYKKRYKNPHNKKNRRSLLHYLLWFIGYYQDPKTTIPNDFVYPNPMDSVEGAHRLTWINHSTFLVEAEGVTFITDPIFNERCSPFSFFGPKRRHLPSPLLERLPQIDVILISHNHYDHLDKKAVQIIYDRNPSVLWILPRGVKSWFKKHLKGIQDHQIIELSWYQTYEHKDFSCTGVPSQHFSGRGIFDHNRTLWMGMVIEIGKKCFYFAGDTGYNGVDFKEVGKRYPKIDLSLLPIGAYKPRRFMKAVHINPEEAVMIHEEIGSLLSVGGHWKTFHLSDEALNQPPYDLYCALQRRELSAEQFRILEPGQIIAW